MAKNDFPKPMPAESYPLGHATDNKDASTLTGFKYPSGGTGDDIGIYKQPMPSPNSLDIGFKKDPNTMSAQESEPGMPARRVSGGDPASKKINRNGEITIRGCGAATKGTKARGPMA
jgi:hypothetical protein